MSRASHHAFFCLSLSLSALAYGATPLEAGVTASAVRTAGQTTGT